MKKISLNIAILPNEEIRNQSIALSNKLSSVVDSHFVLDGKNFHPHFTVYQAHYPASNLDKLRTAVREVAQSLTGLEITMSNYKISHETFVFWSCDKTEELIHVQTEVIAIANPLREGLILPHLADMSDLSAEDKKDIRDYGSILIGPRYDPHITITRIKNPQDADKAVDVLGKSERKTFKPDSLVLALMGDHGTLIEVIEKVSL